MAKKKAKKKTASKAGKTKAADNPGVKRQTKAERQAALIERNALTK